MLKITQTGKKEIMSTEDTLPFVTQRLSTNWLKATIHDKSHSILMICPLDKASRKLP